VDLLNLDTHDEANGVSFNPLRRLIEFAIERAKFDLWIVIIAIVPLLWNPVGRVLRITREKQLVVGSKHVNEKQLKALAERSESPGKSRTFTCDPKIYKILSPEQQKSQRS
jgi:hypothetical protein